MITTFIGAPLPTLPKWGGKRYFAPNGEDKTYFAPFPIWGRVGDGCLLCTFIISIKQ